MPCTKKCKKKDFNARVLAITIANQAYCLDETRLSLFPNVAYFSISTSKRQQDRLLLTFEVL